MKNANNMRNNSNINIKYSTCSNCKNLFLKTHIRIHEESCKKKMDPNKTQKSEVPKTKQIYSTVPKNKIQVYENKQQLIPYYNDSVLNHFFHQYETIFRNFIENKSVAIVGPAQSILNTNNGNIIDKFDIVIRLNKSLPLPEHLKHDIGTKTDIIYNSFNRSDYPGQNNLDTQMYKKAGVSFVCSSYPFNHSIFHDDIAHYVYKYKFEIPVKVMNDGKFRQFENMLKTRPYTGTCAIMDILSYPVRHLYITGLDFYETKYYSEYRKISKSTQKYNKNSTIHQSKPQLDYLKNVSLFDNRIILDPFLDNLLYHDYYKIIRNMMAYDKNHIFCFHDLYLKTYFEMKLSNVSYTRKLIHSHSSQDVYPPFIFTDNIHYQKKESECCIFITPDPRIVQQINHHLQSKKVIGNFYYGNKNNPSIYLDETFIKLVKHQLQKINIHNANLSLLLLFAIFLYFEEKHFFSYQEIINNWGLSNDEKKFIQFLFKKKVLNME